MPLTEQQQKVRYDWYLERVKEARDWVQKVAQSQDKLILTISSGALALSITFTGIITSQGSNLRCVILLGLSWIFLIITIILNLASMWMAIKGVNLYKKNLDEWFKTESLNFDKGENNFDKWTTKTNNTSIITLVLGIILITSFVWFNIQSLIENTMHKNINYQNDRKEKTIPQFDPPLPPPNQEPKPSTDKPEGNNPTPPESTPNDNEKAEPSK
jgi:hypothetical protein